MALRTLKGEKLEAERARLALMREYEDTYAACSAICGIDEAGRGPLAGPVVAGAAILPVDCEILFLNDSKKLSEKRREALFEEIKEKAVAWSVGIVGPDVIDEINILQATYEAMRQAIAGLAVQNRIDGRSKKEPHDGEGCRDDPGCGDQSGADHQGRRQECFHCGSQHPGQSDQGPYDAGVRHLIPGIWICQA